MAALRFAHVNIVARNWRRLAGFYTDVFGCQAVPPERDLRGEWIDAATGVSGVHIQGAHLRLPGCGEAGPTLEIFQYDRTRPAQSPAINRPGLAHIAFAVDNVPAALERIRAHGGSILGELVTTPIQGAGTITFAYARDPEDNIIEIQAWADSSQEKPGDGP